MKATPKVIGRFLDGTDIVEIYCPVCNGDRMERLEDEGYPSEFECCRCGQKFTQDYSSAPLTINKEED